MEIIMEKENFIRMFNNSKSISNLADHLGYKRYKNGNHSPYTYKKIKRKCNEFELNYKNLSKTGMITSKENIGKLKKAVKESYSIREVIKKMGFNVNSGSTYKFMQRTIKRFQFDTSHFTCQLWSKGKTIFTDSRLKKMSRKKETLLWDDVFKKNSKATNPQMSKKLILSGKREYRCSICGINVWNNKPLRLRLDHIDGDCTDNVENNLRFLCPNCDSQTDTFCRGERSKDLSHKWWEDLTDLGNIRPKLKPKPVKILKCKVCGGTVAKNSKHMICRKCYLLCPTNRKVKNRPPISQLLKEVNKLGYVGTGKKYGVSDNAVRKWVKVKK